MNPTLLTPKEVAERFGVHPKTVYRWTKAGKIHAASVTLGGHYRYDESEVQSLLDATNREIINDSDS